MRALGLLAPRADPPILSSSILQAIFILIRVCYLPVHKQPSHCDAFVAPLRALDLVVALGLAHICGNADTSAMEKDRDIKVMMKDLQTSVTPVSLRLSVFRACCSPKLTLATPSFRPCSTRLECSQGIYLPSPPRLVHHGRLLLSLLPLDSPSGFSPSTTRTTSSGSESSLVTPTSFLHPAGQSEEELHVLVTDSSAEVVSSLS